MKKTLHLRRHSIKDGKVKDTIGEKGLQLAHSEGYIVPCGREINDVDHSREETIRFDRLFHGPLVRTAQTALAFCRGLGYMPIIMPVIEELGTAETMAEIGKNKAFNDAVATNMSNLNAVRAAFAEDGARKFADQACLAVEKMFAQMAAGETAVAFGHAPLIDLVYWHSTGDDSVVLAEMEGFVITESPMDGGTGVWIKFGDKITVTRDEPAQG